MSGFPWQSAFEIREQVAGGAVSAVEVTRCLAAKRAFSTASSQSSDESQPSSQSGYAST